MIHEENILPIPFLKKSAFTGSYQGMRFRLGQIKEGDDIFLEAVIWEEPYGFDATSDEKKESSKFPFTEEGITQTVNWLNDKWEQQQERWGKAKENW